MRHVSKFGCQLLLVAMLFVQPGYADEEKSTGTRGGGDALELEFTQIGRRIHQSFEQRLPEVLAALDLSALKSVIKTAEVESTDEKLFVNGKEVSAVNIPSENRILVYRTAWNQIRNTHTKVALVLHEYLGLLGEADSKYEISGHPTLKNFLDHVTTRVSSIDLNQFVGVWEYTEEFENPETIRVLISLVDYQEGGKRLRFDYSIPGWPPIYSEGPAYLEGKLVAEYYSHGDENRNELEIVGVDFGYLDDKVSPFFAAIRYINKNELRLKGLAKLWSFDTGTRFKMREITLKRTNW